MPTNIPFNLPYLSPNIENNIKEVISNKHVSGNGIFTQKCQQFFETKYDIKKALLTTSCTDALEMCAILLDLKEGDEIIIPSYTFVSTANAFAGKGARIVFADSCNENPNLDVNQVEKLITPNTKAIVVVHYAGIACDIEKLSLLAKNHDITLIEDAALGLDAYYDEKALGSIGDLATFSFHETKNITCGEGGLLAINNEKFLDRAEIVWEKGTNRSAFIKGEVDKYGWVDLGSSFLPSEVTAAFLWSQLQYMNEVQGKRVNLWNRYFNNLDNIKDRLPIISPSSTHNGHIFYLLCDNIEQRDTFIQFMKENSIQVSFHYSSLHKSFYFKEKYEGNELKNADRFSQTLLRLPLYFDLKLDDVDQISELVLKFFRSK